MKSKVKTPPPVLVHPAYRLAVSTHFLPRPFTHPSSGPRCFVVLVQVDLGQTGHESQNFLSVALWSLVSQLCVPSGWNFPRLPPASSCCSRQNCILSALRKDKLTGSCSLVLSCHAGIKPRTLCVIGKLAVPESRPWPGSRFSTFDASDSFLFALDFTMC